LPAFVNGIHTLISARKVMIVCWVELPKLVGRSANTAPFCYSVAETLAAVRSTIEQCDFSSKETIDSALKTLASTLGIPYPKLMLLCRLAVTGMTVGLKNPAGKH